MIDCSHLLALVLSAQKKSEEALDMITLTLYDYPDNLNLIITKVILEKHVHGSHKALLTCKEVKRVTLWYIVVYLYCGIYARYINIL